MHRALHALAASLVLQLAGSTVARAQPASEAPSESPPPRDTDQQPPADPGEELVEQLLKSDPGDPDLEWLYSTADEYEPSTLTGKPLPAPALPKRGQGSPRAWDPRWQKFGVGHLILSSGGLVAAVGSSVVPPVETRWRTRNRLDEWGRKHLSISDYESGLWARDVSDVFVSVNVTYPFLIDSLIVAYWYRGSPELGGQMALITLETMAISVGIQGLASALASRERPYVRDCGTKLRPELDDCLETNRYRSYFSGHTSNAFTAASLACGHHLRHELFGSSFADSTACGLAYASASTVGLMRIVGQRHFISDVLSGAAVGSLVGWGVPWLLHYGPLARREPEGAAALRPTWNLIPLPNGLALGGKF